MNENETMRSLRAAEECVWHNPKALPFEEAYAACELTRADIEEASKRLDRFAPVLERLFGELQPAHGIIESPLTAIPSAQRAILGGESEARGIRLFLKRDSDLPVAGSVKARGGIHEVLAHTERIAIEAGLITGPEDDLTKLITPEARAFFGAHSVQVGSTGNLGMSIGIMSAALGYRAIVHMSADAKQWKKDLLRSKGVTVIEYAGDYGEAVRRGREQSEADRMSYFVDDENSRALFLGYAVAGERLKKQLFLQNVPVDAAHPLYVYLPCGVGGAPAGIAFGLKCAFRDAVTCRFVEPTAVPSMLLGFVSGKYHEICVQDIGLSGKTEADGLACGRSSGFAGKLIEPFVEGCSTVRDARLKPLMRALFETEGLFIEPSACAALASVQDFLREKAEPGTHIAWATGGRLMPEAVRRELLGKA